MNRKEAKCFRGHSSSSRRRQQHWEVLLLVLLLLVMLVLLLLVMLVLLLLVMLVLLLLLVLLVLLVMALVISSSKNHSQCSRRSNGWSSSRGYLQMLPLTWLLMQLSVLFPPCQCQ
jgi:uncharacterized membrane protein